MTSDECPLEGILTDLRQLEARDGLIREPLWKKDINNENLIRCVPNAKASAYAEKILNDSEPQDHPSFPQAYHQANRVLWNVIVPIGLYRGKSIFWICENDPSYVFWLSREYGKERHRIHLRQSFFFHISFYALQFEDFRSSKSIFDLEEIAKKEADISGDDSSRLLAFGRFAKLTYSEILRKGSTGDVPAREFLYDTLHSLRPMKGKNRWTDFRDWLNLQGDLTFLSSKPNSSVVFKTPTSVLTTASTTPFLLTSSFHGSSSSLSSNTCEPQSPIILKPAKQATPVDFLISTSCSKSPLLTAKRDEEIDQSSQVSSSNIRVASDFVSRLPRDVLPPSDSLSPPPPPLGPPPPLPSPPLPPPHAGSSDYVSADLLVELGFLRNSLFNCSPAQARFISSELKAIGFLGKYKTPPSDARAVPMWRYPPDPVMRYKPGHLPSLDDFYLHKIFIWFPLYFFTHLLGPDDFPCKDSKCTGHAVRRSENVHGIRLVTEPSGQYYIVSSSLKCSDKSCKHNKSYWAAFNKEYLTLLPPLIKSIFPAHLTHKKAICNSAVDQLLTGTRSPSSLASDFEMAANSRYERLHLQYLELVKLARVQHAKMVKLGSIDALPSVIPQFSSYDDHQGYCGATMSMRYVCELLKAVFVEHKPYLVALVKGVFGTVLRGDHTRKVAKKVQIKGGAVWSYALMNEDQKILSFVLTESDSDTKLDSFFAALKTRYELASVPLAKHIYIDKNCCELPPYTESASARKKSKAIMPVACSSDRTEVQRKSSTCRLKYNPEIEEHLDPNHSISRFGRGCVSEAHPSFSSFLSALSDAYFISDTSDMKRLEIAWKFAQKVGPKPTKEYIRRHCRTQIPPPAELEKRVTEVYNCFKTAFDRETSSYLYSDEMEKVKELQMKHIVRGCLSDPVDSEGNIQYQVRGYVALEHSKDLRCRLPVYSTVRGSSQLEGFHVHQNRNITGTVVGLELYDAQMLPAICLSAICGTWEGTVISCTLKFQMHLIQVCCMN